MTLRTLNLGNPCSMLLCHAGLVASDFGAGLGLRDFLAFNGLVFRFGFFGWGAG